MQQKSWGAHNSFKSKLVGKATVNFGKKVEGNSISAETKKPMLVLASSNCIKIATAGEGKKLV